MTTANVIDPIDHLTGIGKALVQLGENPDAARELRAAFERDDQGGFQDILGRLGIEPPGDICSPYVTIIVGVLVSEWVKYCWWVPRPKEEDQKEIDVATVFPKPLTYEQLFLSLQKEGRMRCDYRLEWHYELRKYEKFVQGMCPPGTV